MVTVTVLSPFRDTTEHVGRKVGDTFTATEERAAEISAKLPGYVKYEKAERGDGLSELSIDELRAIAEERGIEVPKRGGKAKLLSLLEG
jgi:hypothetical protein